MHFRIGIFPFSVHIWLKIYLCLLIKLVLVNWWDCVFCVIFSRQLNKQEVALEASGSWQWLEWEVFFNISSMLLHNAACCFSQCSFNISEHSSHKHVLSIYDLSVPLLMWKHLTALTHIVSQAQMRLPSNVVDLKPPLSLLSAFILWKWFGFIFDNAAKFIIEIAHKLIVVKLWRVSLFN